MVNVDKLYYPNHLGSNRWYMCHGELSYAGHTSFQANHQPGEIHFSWILLERDVYFDGVASRIANGIVPTIKMQWAIYRCAKKGGQEYVLPGNKLVDLGTFEQPSDPEEHMQTIIKLKAGDPIKLSAGYWWIGARNVGDNGPVIMDGQMRVPALSGGIVSDGQSIRVMETTGADMPDSIDIDNDISFVSGPSTASVLRVTGDVS